jgi:hypothetical protein
MIGTSVRLSIMFLRLRTLCALHHGRSAPPPLAVDTIVVVAENLWRWYWPYAKFVVQESAIDHFVGLITSPLSSPAFSFTIPGLDAGPLDRTCLCVPP